MKKRFLPKNFQEILLQYLKSHYTKGAGKLTDWNAKDVHYFSKGVMALNEIFTLKRESTKQNYFFDPVMRSGYLSYFLPVNAMKAFSLFYKIKPQIPKDTIHILDVGSGPLTLSLGYLFFLEQRFKKKKGKWKIHITALEQNDKILKDGIALIEKWLETSSLKDKAAIQVQPHVKNVFDFKPNNKKFDVILIGNFLNEVKTRDFQQKSILSMLKRFSKNNTQVLCLEPAFKKVSRDLQALRDEILACTSFGVVAPCLHHHVCPLNITAKADWCHFSEPWVIPDFIQAFDKKTGLKKTNLMYSYLFLENHHTPTATKQEFVAISNTMQQKGRLEVLGCGPAGRVKFIRSNSNESNQNKDFNSIYRGQLFHYSHIEDSDFDANKITNIGKNQKFIVEDVS